MMTREQIKIGDTLSGYYYSNLNSPRTRAIPQTPKLVTGKVVDVLTTYAHGESVILDNGFGWLHVRITDLIDENACEY